MIMRNRLVVLVLALGIQLAGIAASEGITVGTFDASRAGFANLDTGLLATQAKASLLSNFPGSTIVTTPTLTPSFLASVDVMFVISVRDGGGISPLSAGEQSALFNHVLGGGTAFILAEEYLDHDSAQSVLTPFGVTIADDGVNGLQYGTVHNPSHPIFDGPFGVETDFAVLGSGVFTKLGPYATSLATMNSTGFSILATIEAGALGPGSGRVILMPDATPFADPVVEGYFSEAETLFLNSVAYLVPEPTSYALVAFGLAGLFAFRRLRRA